MSDHRFFDKTYTQPSCLTRICRAARSSRSSIRNSLLTSDSPWPRSLVRVHTELSGQSDYRYLYDMGVFFRLPVHRLGWLWTGQDSCVRFYYGQRIWSWPISLPVLQQTLKPMKDVLSRKSPMSSARKFLLSVHCAKSNCFSISEAILTYAISLIA